MNTVRDNVELLEALIPIIGNPRPPSTPLWELTFLCKHLLQQLSRWEKEGNTKTFEIQSALNAEDFKAFLELLGFNVAEVTEEFVKESEYRNYHVELTE